MPDPKETCAHKLACRQHLYPASWRQYIDDTCQRETEGTLAQCPLLVLMDCGHPRLYQQWPAGSIRWNPICAKCKEEAKNADATV